MMYLESWSPIILEQMTYIPARRSVSRQSQICREGGEDNDDKFTQEQQEITDS